MLGWLLQKIYNFIEGNFLINVSYIFLLFVKNADLCNLLLICGNNLYHDTSNGKMINGKTLNAFNDIYWQKDSKNRSQKVKKNVT